MSLQLCIATSAHERLVHLSSHACARAGLGARVGCCAALMRHAAVLNDLAEACAVQQLQCLSCELQLEGARMG
jgi:hypothetical protein